jgi:uncharacterized protein (DUF1330 family)
MSAYVISEVDVRDPAGFEAYRTIAAAAIAQYGGRYLVRGGAASLAEGGPPPKSIIVVEFPRWKNCANGTPRRNMPRRSSIGGPRSTGD